jgi:hypothetical protein
VASPSLAQALGNTLSSEAWIGVLGGVGWCRVQHLALAYALAMLVLSGTLVVTQAACQQRVHTRAPQTPAGAGLMMSRLLVWCNGHATGFLEGCVLGCAGAIVSCLAGRGKGATTPQAACVALHAQWIGHAGAWVVW